MRLPDTSIIQTTRRAMNRLSVSGLLYAPLVAALLLPSMADGQTKRAMDHPVYEAWDTIGGETLSPDGRWVLFNRLRYDRDAALVVRATGSDVEHVFARGGSARFDAGSRYVAFLIRPARDSTFAARRERRPAAEMPRDTLAILDLASGQLTRVRAVQSFRVAERGGDWLAFQPPAERSGGAGESQRAPTRRKDPGSPLMLRNLATGVERQIENVAAFVFSRDGRRLAFAASTEDGSGDGVFIVDLERGETTPVIEGEGAYRGLAFDEAGDQLAFLTSRDDFATEPPIHALYHWEPRRGEARRIAGTGTAGLPAGWVVSENGGVSFSRNGERILFGTAPAPEPEVEDDRLPEERVRLDVWHWQEPHIQTVQLRRLADERRRTYDAVAHLRDGRVVQLGDLEVPNVIIGARGDADVAIGVANEPYAVESSWDSPNWADHYLIDVRTGERTRIRERVQGFTSLSPAARFAVWYDNASQAWYAMDVRTRNVSELTASIDFPLHNEEHDSPSPASAYGMAGWLPDDAALLIYDRFDIWALDPTGRAAPRNVTQGVGRRDGVRFRVVRLDRDDDYLPAREPALLSAFDPRTKQAGFYHVALRGGAPQQLVMADYMFSTPRKAEDADVLLFTRQSFTEFPDLWVSSPALADMRRITAENPQQAEYLWGTAELVGWTSLDGIPLQGILYKPENFDASRKYPMLTYFYERLSDNLHLHYAPVPHRSRINPTFYTSRGYLVFVPDIIYRIGYPGESAMNSIMPGVTKLLERPYIDRDNLAMQGHSWGGYQIAFMVTRTNMFKAAAPGAPVANMTSAYSGIRLESGLNRQFQYERTQSRLGGNLWEMPVRYLENSPLFWLDKVETPLLIMHNDMDGAVPFQQGLELFLGLRRLGKPAWLINYNDEPHWPTTEANKRDWNVRMQQFFDYYLMEAPAPVWLAEGIPAIRKGRTLGYEAAGLVSDRR
jgi:dipeptidyl aminopeptidase/acylaminoacyl peptidase